VAGETADTPGAALSPGLDDLARSVTVAAVDSEARRIAEDKSPSTMLSPGTTAADDEGGIFARINAAPNADEVSVSLSLSVCVLVCVLVCACVARWRGGGKTECGCGCRGTWRHPT
jgi:hypothetical protein